MNEDLKTNILGQRIKSQREKLKLKNMDIADALGVDKSTVSNWITGHRRPEAPETLAQLAEVLKTSVDYLTGKTDNPLPIDDVIDVRDLLQNRELVYDNKAITDEQRVMFLNILESIIKPKIK